MLRLNTQRQERAIRSEGEELNLHSIFHTIQGEGPYSGVPAVFVRLAGCNIQCPGCDTEYTEGRRNIATGDLVNAVGDIIAENSSTNLVVITGGEPLRQNIAPFIRKLHTMIGCIIQIESNGVAHPGVDFLSTLDDNKAFLVISPKTSAINPDLARRAVAYKYVIKADQLEEKDGLPTVALYHRASPRVARPPDTWFEEYGRRNIFLSPLDEYEPIANQENLEAAAESCLKFGYRLGVQLHKYANLA